MLRAQFRDPLQPRGQPLVRQLAQHRRLALAIAREAGQDRLALGRRHRAALRHHHRVGDRLGQILEQRDHRIGGLHPRIGRALRAIVAFDIGRIGDAQHRIMRAAEAMLGKAARIRGDDRQPAIIRQVEQRRLGPLFHRIVAPREFDIQPIAEQARQPIGIGQRARGLVLGEQPRERPLATGGERDQPAAELGKGVESDMRRQVNRPIEVRPADQFAQIVIAVRVLRVERQPVDHRRDAVRHVGPCHAQHRADYRLHALAERRIGKGHSRIQPIAVGQRRGRKAQLGRALGDRLGLDRPVEHGVGRKDAEGHEPGMRHRPILGRPA